MYSSELIGNLLGYLKLPQTQDTIKFFLAWFRSMSKNLMIIKEICRPVFQWFMYSEYSCLKGLIFISSVMGPYHSQILGLHSVLLWAVDRTAL